MNGFDPKNPEGVISGSFKFKPEIDAAIEEFRDLNVIIRAPETGWLYAPASGLIVVTKEERFQPLPSERHMMANEVEAEFLNQLDQSDFVYIMNPEGYIGDMSIFELGFAHGIRKQIYAKNPLNFDVLGIHDPKLINLLRTSVAVMSPTEAAQDARIRLSIRTDVTSNNTPELNRNGHRQISLSGALGHIAEGTIMRHDDHLLLVGDGRWKQEQLTIPGTRVRHGERRVDALSRLISGKMGVEITKIAHFETSFMIPESGYNRPVDPDTFVFDDHVVDLRTKRVDARDNLVTEWVSFVEVQDLISNGQVEPNAAKLITDYISTAA